MRINIFICIYFILLKFCLKDLAMYVVEKEPTCKCKIHDLSRIVEIDLWFTLILIPRRSGKTTVGS